MRFRPGAKLDTGQVTDARGSRAGGLALGGGGLGQLAPLDGTRVGAGDTPSTIAQDCRTGQDANQRDDCRIVGVVNSVQKFWNGVFTASNRKYQYVDTVFFTDSIQTGCGYASSAVGPFYCPQDKLVYIDLGFFDAVS